VRPQGDWSAPGSRAGTGLARATPAALLAMASIYFFSYFQRTAIPGTVFDQLQTEFGLPASGVAALGSLFTWIYGGMQIVVGIVVDGWGGRRSLLAGGLALALGSLLFPLAHALPLLFAARALTGFGASFMYLSIVKEIGTRFGQEHFPALLGGLLAVGYCGGMTATLPFERAIAAIGWRPALLIEAALSFLALSAAWLMPPSAATGPLQAPRPSLKPLVEVFRNRACLPSFATSFINFPIFFVVLTVLGKKFLQDFAGLDSPSAAATMLAMSATSALAVVAGGLLPRAIGGLRKPILVGASAIVVLATALLLAGTLLAAQAWVFLAGYLLIATAIGLGGPSAGATMKDLNRLEVMASGISVTNALSYIGCGTVAQACGMILDHYHPAGLAQDAILVYPSAAYVALFSFLGLLSLLNFALSLAIPETRPSSGPASAPRYALEGRMPK